MRIGKSESKEKGFVRFEDIGIGCCFRKYDDTVTIANVHIEKD